MDRGTEGVRSLGERRVFGVFALCAKWVNGLKGTLRMSGQSYAFGTNQSEGV